MPLFFLSLGALLSDLEIFFFLTSIYRFHLCWLLTENDTRWMGFTSAKTNPVHFPFPRKGNSHIQAHHPSIPSLIHVWAHCIGMLSDSHLIYLMVSLSESPITINLPNRLPWGKEPNLPLYTYWSQHLRTSLLITDGFSADIPSFPISNFPNVV